jgi:hypothetical protein
LPGTISLWTPHRRWRAAWTDLARRLSGLRAGRAARREALHVQRALSALGAHTLSDIGLGDWVNTDDVTYRAIERHRL